METRGRQFLDQDHDLVVIGGGSAGRAAARAARWSGARVALVSEDFRGGIQPSLALVFASRRERDFARALADARGTVATAGDQDTAEGLRAEGIDVLVGSARFVDPGEIEVGELRVRCGRFIVATGTRPAKPRIGGLDRIHALRPGDVFDLHRAPASLAIIGAGSTGCELAPAFANLGVPVALFEERERILPHEETAASAVVATALRHDGVDVRTGTRVSAFEPSASGSVRIIAQRGEAVVVEQILLAVGRTPFTSGLDLAAADVVVDAAGFVHVDSALRTSGRGTYAAGDVTGLLPGPHAAQAMGRIAAGHALRHGPRGRFDMRALPRVTYTDPEVAAIGLAEHEAPRWARVAEVPFASVDRAIAEGRTDGYCKLIAAPRVATARLLGGRIVGATIVGPHAGDLIAEISLAMRSHIYPARLAQAVHAAPTWSSAVQQCAAQFGVPIDGRRRRRPNRA